MNLPHWVTIILRGLVMLAVPALLVIGSVRLVMTPTFLTLEYNRAGFPPDRYGFTQQDRLEYGPLGVLYIINNEPLSYLGDLELPGDQCWPRQETPCRAFNDLELRHMHDVQVVAQGAFQFGMIAALLTIIASSALWFAKEREALRKALLQGSLLTIGLLVTIIVLAMTAWDLFFSGFHDIFFEPGTWQFYYSDTLIRLYPEAFWFMASLVVGVMTISGAILILLITIPRSRGKADAHVTT